MFNSRDLEAMLQDDTEADDILLAKGLMPGVDVETAVEMLKFEDVQSNKRKQGTLNSEDVPNTSTYDNYDGTDPNRCKNKKLPFKPRERLERTPKEQSHWYQKYLTEENRDAIQRGETSDNASKAEKKLAKQFYSTFRVYWSLFVDLTYIAIDKGFHDITKKDACGFAHDLELLLLGSLCFHDITKKE